MDAQSVKSLLKELSANLSELHGLAFGCVELECLEGGEALPSKGRKREISAGILSLCTSLRARSY